MKFKVKITSYCELDEKEKDKLLCWGLKRNKEDEEDNMSYIIELGEVEINDLSDLLKFIQDFGRIICTQDEIEIYNYWRE